MDGAIAADIKVDVIAAFVETEGELCDIGHQPLEEVGQLGAVLDEDVPVLTVGEVVVAQIGTADDQGVVKQVDFAVLHSDCLRKFGGHDFFRETAQHRRVVKVGLNVLGRKSSLYQMAK